MKSILSLLLLITCLACQSKADKTAGPEAAGVETSTDTSAAAPGEPATAQLYACPMHPEVTGKKGAECSQCGMPLSEPVTETKP